MLAYTFGHVFAAMTMASCAASTASTAPQPSPDVMILQAVVREIEAIVDPAAVLLLDPQLFPVPEGTRFPGSFGEGPIVGPAHIPVLLAGTRVAIGRYDEVFQCPSGPPSCHFIGADAFLRLSEVMRIDGKTMVWAELRRRSDPRHSYSRSQPIEMIAWRVTLEPGVTGWRVTDMRVSEVS